MAGNCARPRAYRRRHSRDFPLACTRTRAGIGPRQARTALFRFRETRRCLAWRSLTGRPVQLQMTDILTVRVRLPDCSSPPAGLLMSAYGSARVRGADCRVPDQSVCRTAGIRLPNGFGPSIDLLETASRRAEVRIPDYSIPRATGVSPSDDSRPGRSVSPVVGRVARSATRRVVRHELSSPGARSRWSRFTKKQLVTCRLAPTTPYSDDTARGTELLECDRDGAARQARHPSQVG